MAALADYSARKYEGLIRSIAFSRCGSVDWVDDVFQEVLYALMRKKEGFKDEEHLKAWLIRAAIHRSLNVATRNKKYISVSADSLEVGIRSASFAKESGVVFGDLIESLPAHLRVPLFLHYYCGFKVSEIALLLGKSETAIKSLMHRARRMLRDALVIVVLLTVSFSPMLGLFDDASHKFGSVDIDVLEYAYALDPEDAQIVQLDYLKVDHVVKTENGVKVFYPIELFDSRKKFKYVNVSFDDQRATFVRDSASLFGSLPSGSLYGQTVGSCRSGSVYFYICVNVEEGDLNGSVDYHEYEKASKSILKNTQMSIHYLRDGDTESDSSIIYFK